MKKNNSLPPLLKVIPPPKGLTAHPDRLLTVFLMELRAAKERFSPDVFAYMQNALIQIIEGADPKVAFKLDLRKRNEAEWMMRICMVNEIITRKENKEKLVDIYADLSKNGYTWYGKKHHMGVKSIEKMYDELKQIISKKQKVKKKLRKD